MPQRTLGQVGQRSRGFLTRQQRLEDGPRRGTGHIADDRSELEVRPFERFLQPIDLGTALVDQARSIPNQLPQLALGSVGHEAAPHQAVPQQIG